MITVHTISSIKTEQLIHDRFKVKRIDSDVYKIIGYHYGIEEVKHIGNAEEVAKFINGYFGHMGS